MIKRLIADWKNYANEENILIYQMGKVGSTSLEQTIPGSIHFHTLYNNRPCYIFGQQKRNTIAKKVKGKMYDWLRRTAIRNRKTVKIITLTRDPYSRNISAFFQDFAYWMYYHACNSTEEQRIHGNNGLVYDVYNKLFSHAYALTWFDDELKKLTGVDIYEYDFDKKAGYNIIRKGKYEILVLTLEKMEDVWPIIGEFVGLQMELKNANQASSKWYGEIYKDFVKGYKPTSNYLDMLYNSKMSRYFYTQDELDGFRKKAVKLNSAK